IHVGQPQCAASCSKPRCRHAGSALVLLTPPQTASCSASVGLPATTEGTRAHGQLVLRCHTLAPLPPAASSTTVCSPNVPALAATICAALSHPLNCTPRLSTLPHTLHFPMGTQLGDRVHPREKRA